ncbi:MAG: hypothetical protein M3Q28_09535, partial [Pseudomonadota bacterium]|nr:hypothetical protein [Pseudomonadota bacterium]
AEARLRTDGGGGGPSHVSMMSAFVNHGPEAFSKREETGSDQQRANRGFRTSPDRDAAFI